MEDDLQNLTNANRKLGKALEDKRQASLISSIVTALLVAAPGLLVDVLLIVPVWLRSYSLLS